MTIAIQMYLGRWDGWYLEHYLDAMPSPGTLVEYPATGRFNSVYMFCGDAWRFVCYRDVATADLNCKGK